METKSKLSFLFFLFFHCVAFAGAPLDRVLVIVNDSVITEIELETRLQLVKKQLGSQRQIPENELRQQLLDRLILDKIQQQLAERSGILIDDTALAQAINDIMKNNQLSSQAFKDRLAQDGIDYDTFR